jgi:hypothetical protein
VELDDVGHSGVLGVERATAGARSSPLVRTGLRSGLTAGTSLGRRVPLKQTCRTEELPNECSRKQQDPDEEHRRERHEIGEQEFHHD